MRVTALGAYRMKGIAKKSGAPYDMAKLVIRVPIDTAATQTMQRAGYGFTVNELDMLPDAIGRFGFSFPPEGLELDLEVDNIVEYGRMKAVIVGAKKVQETAPARKAA